MLVGMWVIRTAESVVLTPCPPGPGAAEDVDPQVLLVDVDLVRTLDDRGHFDPGEGGLAARLVVERADAYQPVHAVLAAQRAVREGRRDLERRALQARFFGVGGVEHLGRPAVTLSPAQIHAQQHFGPVGGVDPARTGRQLHDRLAGVVLPRQQGAYLERLDLFRQRRKRGLGLQR